MRRIVLNTGDIAIVSEQHYNHLNQSKWYLDSSGYAARRRNGIIIRMQNEVAELINMQLNSGEEIDHKDRNRLNNQDDNLRPATYSQQMANRVKKENCLLNSIGVRLTPKGRYKAYSKHDGHQVNLGVFDTEEQAARKRDSYVKKFFKGFAVLNFPEDSNE
jgi:HNH endonuclease/AP2 domain